jgi:cold shock CspA family protein
MFMAMAILLRRLERWQDAYEHLQLARMITEEKDWTRPAETLRMQLAQFEERYGELFRPDDTPTDFQALTRRLKPLWQRDISAARPHGRGMIKNMNDRSGFIRTDNGDYYFNLRDVPRHITLEIGMEVEFELEEGYDQKKQRESLKAVRIRPVKRHGS